MTRVLIYPTPTVQPANHGIGRVVHAQYTHLPRYGIELVSDEQAADVVVIHAGRNPYKRVDVLSCHGVYWLGDKGSGDYTQWHSDANRGIISMARQAHAITVPSDWVAMTFKRDMRISPHVIGHGIDASEWTLGVNGGYVLWGKNRGGDVCNPQPAWELAMKGTQVVSTFAPDGVQIPGSMRVTGSLSHADMREMVRNADVYLATVKETFGIQTLEAMACGVPVLGYAHGGTADIVRHKVDGYLARPGHLDDLIEGLAWIRAHRKELSGQARERALTFTWERVAEQYANLYARVASDMQTERKGVSVIVTCYNYGRYLSQCIDSLLAQSYRVDEIIVVDDGSTDDTSRVAMRYKQQGILYVRQNNQGVAHARNHGIALATQPFIVCLDADDQLHPRYVEVTRAEMLRDHSLGIAYTGLVVLNENGTRQATGWPPEFSWESQATPHVPPSNCVPSAAMFRRSMWERAGGYRQEYKPGEDAEFWTRGLSVGFTAKRVTDSPWFIYRAHSASASRTNRYVPTDIYAPWMRDHDWPLGAPSKEVARPRSYSEPRVSVIIPVGPGHAKYLPQALDSLVGQTMHEWEVIVILDGIQTDDVTRGIFDPYPFVRFFLSGGKGKGAGYARNIGIEHARAPLVFFLDADDYLHPHALAKLCKAYAKGGGRYVYGDWSELRDGKLIAKRSPDYDPSNWIQFDTVEASGKHIVSVLMATEDARRVKFDEALPFWEDWEYFTHCATLGIRGYRIAEQTLIVRRDTSINSKRAFAPDGRAGEVITTLRQRYAEYTEGRSIMGKCCGGNADAILAARRAWDDMAQDTGGLSTLITTRHGRVNGNGDNDMAVKNHGAPVDGVQPVRMEFTGERQGGVTYNGKDGRSYVGGNNALERYANVHPEDTAKLESTGDWKRVNVPVLQDAPNQRGDAPQETPRVTVSGPVEDVRFARVDVTQFETRDNPAEVATESTLKDTEPMEVVQTKVIETGAGVITRKRTTRKKEAETVLKDLPEQ